MQRMVSFGKAISMGFRNYAAFYGRSSRSEYWWWTLFNFIVCSGVAILAVAIAAETRSPEVMIIAILPALVFFIPNMAIAVRRLHDVGRGGIWYFLPLICNLATFLISLIGSASAVRHSYSYYYTSYEIPVIFSVLIIISTVASLGFAITYFVFTLLPSQNYENRFGEIPNYDEDDYDGYQPQRPARREHSDPFDEVLDNE